MGAVGVLASVGHGKKVGLGVLQLEVLIGELLSVDGLATGALDCTFRMCLDLSRVWRPTHVALGEVTTLKHEVGDNTVEGRSGVAKTMLASGKLTEVGGGLRDDVVEELEHDAAQGLCERVRTGENEAETTLGNLRPSAVTSK